MSFDLLVQGLKKTISVGAQRVTRLCHTQKATATGRYYYVDEIREILIHIAANPRKKRNQDHGERKVVISNKHLVAFKKL